MSSASKDDRIGVCTKYSRQVKEKEGGPGGQGGPSPGTAGSGHNHHVQGPGLRPQSSRRGCGEVEEQVSSWLPPSYQFLCAN